MSIKTWVFSFLLCLVHSYHEDRCDYIYNIISRHGYSYELHNVTTADGYILTIFRITGLVGAEGSENKPGIVLQHGISTSPNSFVGNGESSIAFYLANRGFDVWIPSARGTYYSREHVTLSFHEEKYWDYSFEELGTKDTKAYLEYIYKFKGRKVFYFGFSQGFTQIMAAFSLDPEFFKERLEKIVGWGPVIRLDLSSNVWIALATHLKIWSFLGLSNCLNVTHTSSFSRESCLAKYSKCLRLNPFCRLISMFGSEFVPYNNNPYYATGTDASSIKCFQHLAYNVYHGGFFRHPSNGEKVEYDLRKIEGVPLGLCIGEADMLAPLSSVAWFKEKFKNNKDFKMIGVYKYLGHKTFKASYTLFQHYTDTVSYTHLTLPTICSV
eukprot:TRINITY_DN1382_c0_g1_i9.p1 TRINITY_DN1382_c0_g1~~TRINITY_DN1382_c0_g1_i9.p1  ORF type:complete len:382 (-),score=77.62 TRINITY_DN1382_c0_g1_i9:41-1186(-)